jgi:mono/diheme cytochrome c family protein
VTEGRKGKMPAWGDTLTKAEIEAVVDYEREELSPGSGDD